jgi:hypothetical protein
MKHRILREPEGDAASPDRDAGSCEPEIATLLGQ